MNKKGFLTRDIIITGLLFTGIVSLFVIAIGGVADNYDNTEIINDQFSENYDKLSEIAGNVDIARNSTQKGEGITFLGTFDVVFSATFTVIKMVFNTLDLYGDISANFISDFTFLDAGVVKVLFLVGLAIITTILVFVWISAISRGKI